MVPTIAAQNPPISSCPLAPMLNRPALKPMATESPVKISGVAALSVFAMALGLPEGALEHRAVGRDRQRQVERVAGPDRAPR